MAWTSNGEAAVFNSSNEAPFPPQLFTCLSKATCFYLFILKYLNISCPTSISQGLWRADDSILNGGGNGNGICQRQGITSSRRSSGHRW